MFGMFSIDAAEGMLDQKESNNKRRSDIAKLFSDYRRENPYATATDLSNYADSIVGSDFYLRPGSAEGDALKAIAEEHRVNRVIRDRDRTMNSMEQNRKLEENVLGRFETYFKQSGDVKEALDLTKKEFTQDMPTDSAMSQTINNALSALNQRAEGIGQNIIYRGLGENEAQFKGQISAGETRESIMPGLPVFMQNSEVVASYIDSLAKTQDNAFRNAGLQRVTTLLTDPKISQSIGYGDLSLIKNALGEREFERLNIGPDGQDGYLENFIFNSATSQRLNTWGDKTAAASKAALTYGTGKREARQAQNASVFASLTSMDGNQGLYAQNAIAQILGSFVIEPNAYGTITSIIEAKNYDSTDELVDQIESTVPNGSLVPVNQYETIYAQQYMNSQNLGGEAPQTFPEFYQQNLGKDGTIGKETSKTIATSQNIKNDTATLYGGTNAFGLPTPSSFQSHVRDLDATIADNTAMLEQLERYRRTMKNPSLFLPSANVIQGGENIDGQALSQKGDAEIIQQMEKIKTNISELREKQTQVKKEFMRVNRKNRPFGDFSEDEIQQAAMAMADYADKTGQSFQTLALMYAAQMNVKGGQTPGRRAKFSPDQRRLADELRRRVQ